MSPLPPLLLMDDAGGDWQRYVSLAYEAFKRTMVEDVVLFQGLKVSAPFRPEDQGKHASFWHVTSEGDGPECERTPDLRRCERIAWIRWVIDNADSDPRVSWWENTRRSGRGPQRHFVLLLETERFAVVLAKRGPRDGEYFVLRTAYCVERDHRLQALVKERDAWRLRCGC